MVLKLLIYSSTFTHTHTQDFSVIQNSAIWVGPVVYHERTQYNLQNCFATENINIWRTQLASRGLILNSCISPKCILVTSPGESLRLGQWEFLTAWPWNWLTTASLSWANDHSERDCCRFSVNVRQVLVQSKPQLYMTTRSINPGIYRIWWTV